MVIWLLQLRMEHQAERARPASRGFILSTMGHSRMWTLDCRKDPRVRLQWPGRHLLRPAPGFFMP